MSVHPLLQLWANPQDGMSINERLDCLMRLNAVNKALDECFKGKLSFSDWCAIAEYNGVDVDSYLDALEHNLTYAFGINVDNP